MCAFLISTIMTEFIKNRQRAGFGLLGIILVTAIIVLLAVGGGLYWNETQKQKSLIEAGNELERRAEEVKKQIEAKQNDISKELGESSSIDTSNWKTYPSTSSGQAAIDTTDWKLYRNEKYGFEIKHPEDFTDSLKGYDDILFSKKEVFNPMTTFYGPKPEPRELLIWSISVARKATLDTFCEDWVRVGYTKKNISLNGIDAARCTNVNLYQPNTFVAISQNGNLIIFTLHYYYHNEYLSMFDQILSTFKFIK